MVQIKEAVDLTYLEPLALLFEGYRKFYKQDLSLERTTKFLTERLTKKDSVIYLLFDGEELDGFVQLYPLPESLKCSYWMLLNDLYVDPAHRGKGYGKLLLGRAQELARATNLTGLLLETQKTNAIGNKLYPSVGFDWYSWTNTEWKAE